MAAQSHSGKRRGKGTIGREQRAASTDRGRKQKRSDTRRLGAKRTASKRKPVARLRSRPGELEAGNASSAATLARRAGRFPIAGIGASAGGLEALGQLFAQMPRNIGVGFVVVVHQPPGHASMLPELIGRVTQLEVHAAADGTKVEPNRVYVVPPGARFDILDGILHRFDVESPDRPHATIDHFLRSLALDQRENAICIILSGSGTDGTLGLKAVKEQSGMAMVQQVQSAKFAGMPSSAVATGMADYVMPVERMPQRLVAYARGAYLAPAPRQAREIPAEPMQKIFLLLRTRTGHDFSAYKANTMRRRIERRMSLHQIDKPDRYVRYLQENPHEIDVLFRELLISVTRFFRDPEAFETLARSALPALIDARPEKHSLRVWSVGCATGEEVYSLAILIRECLDARRRSMDVQIFGTDLDSQAIDVARQGVYESGIAVDVSAERLERFFSRDEGGYRIRKAIREMAVFAMQNVIKDPPFTKIDLITCRNLFIYLSADMQKQLLALFHYALKPDGVLFLGPSESLGGSGEGFDAVDSKWKIFRRRQAAVGSQRMNWPIEAGRRAAGAQALPTVRSARAGNLAELVDRLLVGRFAPASVVVNEQGSVIYIHGRTGAYLEPAAGHPRLMITELAREGLRLELASAFRQAIRDKAEETRRIARVRTNGNFLHVDLSVLRIAEPETLRGLFLISFRPRPPVPEPTGRKTGAASGHHAARTDALSRELHDAKESLQITVEELETSNEELQSINEELQSTNEELQSANEELETSKEEMQSLNEELTTLNSQLYAKVEELSHANDDMQNLLNSTDVATIFLDREMRIKRFTAQARTFTHLTRADIGRHFSDLVSKLHYDRLIDDCSEVLRTLVCTQAEVQTHEGRWLLMRITPYRTTDNVIDGVVVTFVDIGAMKQAELDLEAERQRHEKDLDGMSCIHEIGMRFGRGEALPSILDQALEAAMAIARADGGIMHLKDPRLRRFRVQSQRGFREEWLDRWENAINATDTSRIEALFKERSWIDAMTATPGYASSLAVECLLKEGVQAVQLSPLTSRSGDVIGAIATFFASAQRPDTNTMRLLDFLGRQTAQMLEGRPVWQAAHAGKDAP